MCKYFQSAFLVLAAFLSSAQELYDVYVDQQRTAQKAFGDSLEAEQFIHEMLASFLEKGYLFSGLDSVRDRSIYLHRGTSHELTIREVLAYDPEVGVFQQLPFEEVGVWKNARRFLTVYTNNGYPFARIRADSIHPTSGNGYQVTLLIDPGPFITVDTLVLFRPLPVRRTFLENVIDMKKGDPFGERKFRQLPARFDRVSFLQLESSPDVSFEDGKSTIYLDLRQRAGNSFEGVLGLLPNQSASSRLVLTGYLDLSLANLFRSGRQFDFSWNRFADESQSLDLRYKHPYFLSSPVFLNAGFKLLKQDTTFLTQSWRVGGGIYLSDRLDLMLDYQRTTGSLISTERIGAGSQLADYRRNLYSIRAESPSYGRAIGFRNVFKAMAAVSAGSKDIVRNPAISAEFYDSLTLQTLLLNLEGGIQYQVRTYGKLAFNHRIESAFTFSELLLTNELHRPGGFRSIRGFNENFFFARHYALSRMELRQYFEENSFFMLFCDQMAYKQNKSWDFPIGFGAGLSLNTSNGLFTFALAMGSAEKIPLDFEAIKVHLGYTSRF